MLWRIDKDLNAFEIKHVFDEIDLDGNGEIDFEEFKKAFWISES